MVAMAGACLADLVRHGRWSFLVRQLARVIDLDRATIPLDLSETDRARIRRLQVWQVQPLPQVPSLRHSVFHVP
jgi:hypothetical protein